MKITPRTTPNSQNILLTAIEAAGHARHPADCIGADFVITASLPTTPLPLTAPAPPRGML